MIGDEFSEGAKAAKESAIAVQELAKTAKSGIEATEKLGSFVSRLIHEPLDEVMGILTDRLQFFRWERRVRFTRRANEIIEGRAIEEPLSTISPKLAFPIIENASMEENDELQDIWANLLASAVDPSFEGVIRSAFIDILKQLEVIDAHILNLLYSHFLNRVDEIRAKRPDLEGQQLTFDPSQFDVHADLVIERLNIPRKSEYREAVDNLIRVGCVAPYIQTETVHVPSEYQNIIDPFMASGMGPDRLDVDAIEIAKPQGYKRICLTSLGLAFTKACMAPKSGNNKEN